MDDSYYSDFLWILINIPLVWASPSPDDNSSPILDIPSSLNYHSSVLAFSEMELDLDRTLRSVTVGGPLRLVEKFHVRECSTSDAGFRRLFARIGLARNVLLLFRE